MFNQIKDILEVIYYMVAIIAAVLASIAVWGEIYTKKLKVTRKKTDKMIIRNTTDENNLDRRNLPETYQIYVNHKHLFWLSALFIVVITEYVRFDVFNMDIFLLVMFFYIGSSMHPAKMSYWGSAICILILIYEFIGFKFSVQYVLWGLKLLSVKQLYIVMSATLFFIGNSLSKPMDWLFLKLSALIDICFANTS